MPVNPSKQALVNAVVQTTISPPQLTANQNNYEPTGWALADVLRVSTDASRIITGFNSLSATQSVKTIVNVGSNDLVLAHEDGSSADINRILTLDSLSLTVEPKQAVTIYYDPTTQRWRSIAGSAAGSGGGGVNRLFGFAGVVSNPSDGGQRIGAIVFDGSTPGLTTATFVAILETTSASYGAVAELYDTVAEAVVGNSTVTSTSLTPEKQSAALAIPGDLPASERVYEVYLRMATYNEGDTARCLAAYLEF